MSAAPGQRAPRYPDPEWTLRVELAALYRIFDHLGWSELIYNHISVKLPGPDEHFLINPYGLHYSEVQASNLVKVDLDGALVEPGEHIINPAGFVIHSAIHRARPDAVCVAHTHTTAGLAVACQRDGLRGDNFYSCLVSERVAYHDFEGITVRDGERERLVASLGARDLLILRSHGLLACGRSVAAAFSNMWVLQRACEIQVATDACGRPRVPIRPEIREQSARGLQVMMKAGSHGRLEFDAMVRMVERVDPSFRE